MGHTTTGAPALSWTPLPGLLDFVTQLISLQAPEDPSKGPSKPAVKKTSKKAAGPENAGPKVKRAKNAFIYFSAEKRAAVKGRAQCKFSLQQVAAHRCHLHFHQHEFMILPALSLSVPQLLFRSLQT